ncbi:irregular chiasm C-roughest protein-like isoform X2 [Adelges cooleyi]|uniref:irregular chiasm C-roughest protein-like isoform X2 n=1 Tax=Adelges cooleyi TaxID=133065 RepID=UPI00217F54A1|nr:irregular chiasm C-roughest protein-like isoform X2 [Adelges cooleyi]
MKRLKITTSSLIAAIGILCAATLVDGQRYQQSFATEPDDLKALVNGTVSLPCRVTNLAGQLQWTKDDFALGTNRNLSYHGYPRYSMVGNDDRGEYNLLVNPVTLDDEGIYQCQVGVGVHDEPAIRSRKAVLSVMVPPGQPRILQGEFMTTTEDRPIELECVSEGGKPAADISWTDGTGIAFTEGISTSSTTMAIDNRRFVTRSILKFLPKKEYHNTSIWCQALSIAIENRLRTKIHMHIKFAPKAIVTIGSPVSDILEGSDVQFLCTAKANPPEITYRWYVNEQFVSGETTPELWMLNVTRKYHNSVVRCDTSNVIGRADATKVLNILYKPQFKVRPRNVQAEAGNTVTLMCAVDSNPAPEIVWTHEKTNKVVGTLPTLLVLVSASTAGRYFCRATTQGFGEIGADMSVVLKSPPVIITKSVQYGVVGDTVRIDCIAYSVPVADRIVWTYQGTELGVPGQKYYTILEEMVEGGEAVKSILVIKDTRIEHFGTYNCTASNVYGVDSFNITLKAKNSFLNSSKIVVAGGALVVVVAIVAAVMVCRRLNTTVAAPPTDKKTTIKNEFVAEPDKQVYTKESDEASNLSDIKMEMGTAGSSLSSTYQYKADFGDGAVGTSVVASGSDRTGTPKSGSETGGPRAGIPLAGPVPVDPRYSVVSTGQLYSMASSHGDYADPMYRIASRSSDRPASSSNYIAADRLYDISPTAAVSGPSSMQGNMGLPSLQDPVTGGPSMSAGSPATILQYSATYGNPYLKSNAAQWTPANNLYDRLEPPPYNVMRSGGQFQQKLLQQQLQQKSMQTQIQKQGPAGRSTSVVLSNGNNYHMGTAKRQTLATHV